MKRTYCKQCRFPQAEMADKETVPQGEDGGLCWARWGSCCHDLVPLVFGGEVGRVEIGHGPSGKRSERLDAMRRAGSPAWEAAYRQLEQWVGQLIPIAEEAAIAAEADGCSSPGIDLEKWLSKKPPRLFSPAGSTTSDRPDDPPNTCVSPTTRVS